MKYKYSTLLYFFLLIFMTLAQAQENFNRFEEDPRAAEKWFFEMRKNYEGIYPVGKRWEAYLQMRSNTLNTPVTLPTANWESLGPNTMDGFSGRMISHDFDPQDNQIIYSGAATGGLWRSTNHGNNWESMMTNFPSLEISSIAVKPSDRNVMLIGTGVDRAITFTTRPGIGVFRSTNRGLSWELTSFSYQLSASIGVSRIVWDPAGTDIVLMAASNGLWKSVDGGINWTMKKSGRVSDITVNKLNPNIYYTVIRQDGVYKSIDKGDTWIKVTQGLPNTLSIGLSSLSICDSLPNILYVSFTDANTFKHAGLFKSTDDGESWTEIGTPVIDVACQPRFQNLCSGWYVNQVQVSPTDPDYILLGAVTLWQSYDGGENWEWLDIQRDNFNTTEDVTYVDQADIGFDPIDDEFIFVFNDGGIQTSSDKGGTWSKSNDDLVTALIYGIGSAPSDTNIVTIGCQDQGFQVVNTENGNKFWKMWYPADGVKVIIHPTDPKIMYGNVFFGNIFRTTTGGVNWLSTTHSRRNGITETGALVAPLIMNMDEPLILYTSTTSKIYKTINGGAQWVTIATIPNIKTIELDEVNKDIVYAHSYTNTSWSFWRSENAGDSWVEITNSSIPSWRVVDLEADPSNEGTLYAVRNSAFANNDHVKKSTDYGETWVDITNNLPDITCNAIAISPYTPDHLYLATDLGVFVSTNGGGEWNEYNDGLPLTYVSDIHYHPLDKTLRISTIGRGVYKTPAIDANITNIEDKSNVPKEFVVFSNYPNPFNPSTTMEFEISRTSFVQVKIYNEMGQEIRELIDNEFTSGMHSLVWDGKNSFGLSVSSGTYYARFIAGNKAKSIKMLLLK